MTDPDNSAQKQAQPPRSRETLATWATAIFGDFSKADCILVGFLFGALASASVVASVSFILSTTFSRVTP